MFTDMIPSVVHSVQRYRSHMPAPWNRALLASKAKEYLHKNVMLQAEYNTFLGKRNWLEEKFSGFSLASVLPNAGGAVESEIAAELKGVSPRLLLYGSSVAGTAFRHGDADFAVVFPATQKLRSLLGAPSQATAPRSSSADANSPKDESVPKAIDVTALSCTAGLVTIDRISQPTVLNALYDFVKMRQHESSDGCGKDAPLLQRIFRARIPIMQYVPSLAELQAANRSGTAAAAGLPPHVISNNDARGAHEKREHYDISLSIDGGRNSLLIRQYMSQFPELRVACFILKQWGRKTKILNARRGWISPYAMTIMLIHFMKEANRIPCLIEPQSVDVVVSAVADRMLAATSEGGVQGAYSHECLDNLLAFEPEQLDAKVFEDAADIVRGFLEFYGGVGSTFDFDTHVVDIRVDERRVTNKEEWFSAEEKEAIPQGEVWHRIGHGVLMIRDPYENHSLGRSVCFFRGESIREQMRVAAVEGIDVDALLPCE